MTIRGWKKGSSHVVMILDHDEFYFFRLALMKSKKDHWPGDGTCNGHAYTVVNAICHMSFDEWMMYPKMIYPGEGRADRITIHLNSHDYTDFQELLENWFEQTDDDPATAIAGKIISTSWVMATDRIGDMPAVFFKQIEK